MKNLGRNRTYWHGKFKDLEQWLKSCTDFAEKKRSINNSVLLPIPLAGPWNDIAADYISPLQTSLTGNKYIIVIGNLFTKYVQY